MKISILIALFAAFLFSSCHEEETLGAFKYGIEEVFKYGEIYQLDNNSLKFSITEINDSRCPKGVYCFWAGSANVKLVFELPQKGSLFLKTYDNRIDTFANYSFELIDVSPYPISTETIELEDYNVTLKITELSD